MRNVFNLFQDVRFRNERSNSKYYSTVFDFYCRKIHVVTLLHYYSLFGIVTVMMEYKSSNSKVKYFLFYLYSNRKGSETVINVKEKN